MLPQEGRASRGAARVSLQDIGLSPSLHVIALKPGRTQPEMAGAPDLSTGPDAGTTAGDSPGDISLAREWPLVVFTLGAAVLVGVIAGAAAGTVRVAWWAFALAAAVVMGVAGAHLGRPGRSWRAVLNVRRSWLSREIVAMSVFVASATLWLFGGDPGSRAGWFVVVLGLVALYAADRVYAVLPSGPGYRHSASVLLTGVLFAALFAQRFNVALAVLAVKLALYSRPTVVPGLPRWLPPLRIALGLLVPLVAGSAAMLGHPAVLACIAAGEALDRCEYYIRIERRTPRRAFDGALFQITGSRQEAGAPAARRASRRGPQRGNRVGVEEG
jgi:DMSO reductase anchor subunit